MRQNAAQYVAPDTGVLHALASASPVGMLVVDEHDGTVVWSNTASTRLLGAGLPAGSPFGVPLDAPSTIQGRGGRSVTMQSSIGMLDGRRVRLIALTDVTDDKARILTLTRAASTDPLTGLLHRRGMRELVNAERANLPSVAVMFVDLDDFKDINDTWGHDVGDLVLVTVAQRMSNILRSGDVLARWGGDEFLILTTGAPAAARLVGRATAALADPISFDGGCEVVRATIGWVANRIPNWDLDDLVRRADREMYIRKTVSGRASTPTPNPTPDADSVDLDLDLDRGGSTVVDVRDRHPTGRQ